jgi:hypothetical protein
MTRQLRTSLASGRRSRLSREEVEKILANGDWLRFKYGKSDHSVVQGTTIRRLYSEGRASEFRTVGNRYVLSLGDGWAEQEIPGK